MELPSEGFYLCVSVQKRVPETMVLNHYKGYKLAEKMAQIGYDKILQLVDRLADAGMLHGDLNPGNLIISGRNLGVIDLAATMPEFFEKTGVRMLAPPRHEKHPVDPQRVQDELARQWRRASMLRKFTQSWEGFSKNNRTFQRNVYKPIVDELGAACRDFGERLAKRADPASYSSLLGRRGVHRLLDFNMFVWGGQGSTTETYDPRAMA